jgi:hypothetical protein
MTVTLPTKARRSGLGSEAPWLRCASTGLMAFSGTTTFERNTVIWITHASQPFTVIWESAGILHSERADSESPARW